MAKGKKNDKKESVTKTAVVGEAPTIRLSVHGLAAEVDSVSALAVSILQVVDKDSAAYAETMDFLKHIAAAKQSVKAACGALKANPMYRDFKVGSAQ